MLNSTVWTLGERLLSLGLTWVVGIIVANHLGVASFGLLAYVVAIVTLAATLVTGGLSGIVVRDLVTKHDERHVILGTVFGVRAVAGVLSVATLLGVTFITGQDPDERLLTAIVALGLCFQVSEVISFWFQSQTALRFQSMATIGGAIVGAVVRLSLVASDAGLTLFAWAIAIEQATTAGLLFLMYRAKAGSFRRWRFESARAKAYIVQSLPLILSGIASTVNLRVDLVLLGLLQTSSAVGIYAVAARLSEVWYFVPTAVAAAVFPAIIRLHKGPEEQYRRRLQQLYGMFAWGAIGVAILISFVGGPLIRLLYDAEFADAANVLVIHVWTAPFLFMSVIFSKWLVVEGLLWMSLVRHGTAAVLNVALNLILIPKHGPEGAAVATLISYAVATYGASFFSRKTWPAAVDMSMGLLWPLRLAADAVRSARRG